jgi:tRNA(Ile)-lysidine synthase
VEGAFRVIDRGRMVAAGDTILVAVSGGPDSTCLLDVLWRSASRLEIELEIAHFDHGLSDDSERVAARVAATASEAGFEVHVMRAPDELTGPNLHARARALRYGFFEAIAAQIGAARIATGHTLDDRVETTLARLVHGAGTEGLAGIPSSEGLRIRPLIETRRGTTRAYCDELGLAYHDDPANTDVRFERAAVRTELVPAIEGRWGEGAVTAIARSAEHLLHDARALSDLGDRLYADLARDEGNEVAFETGAFEALPRALRRRLIETAVGRVRDRAGGIDAALDAIDAGTRTGARFAVASGLEIVLDRTDVRIMRPPSGNGENR